MRLIMLLIAAAVTVSAQASDVAKVRVTGGSVGLRAAPGVEAQLLDRAMRGDELVFLEKANGWVAVQAPESLEFWVASQYVHEGVVNAKTLRVRSGPSTDFDVVGVVSRGDFVTPQGETDAWVRIASPTGDRVWISESYVAMVEPSPEAPMVEPMVEAAPEVAPMPVASAYVAPNDEEQSLTLVLDNSRPQGIEEEVPGVLRRANPGLYKLVLSKDGIEKPVCLVRGNTAEMERYLNRSMLMKGKKYWAKDVALPIIQPNKIYL